MHESDTVPFGVFVGTNREFGQCFFHVRSEAKGQFVCSQPFFNSSASYLLRSSFVLGEVGGHCIPKFVLLDGVLSVSRRYLLGTIFSGGRVIIMVPLYSRIESTYLM